MSKPTIDRLRRTMLAFAGVAPALVWAKMFSPTPRQTAGPFYPEQLPADDDHDLTRVGGNEAIAEGDITDLSGRVVDVNGAPLGDVHIEIWQCDANGRYHHPRDTRQVRADRNFQGHGRAVTDHEGNYRFRTIRPVPYPGRTPHIHAAVFPSGQRPLVTQIYIKGEPRNAEDFLFNRIPVEKRSRVVAAFSPATGSDATFSARFDFVVGVAPQEA